MFAGHFFDAGAAALPVVPEADEFGDGVEAKTHVARAADEAQRVHVVFAVLAVIAAGARHFAQQTQRFVVAQHLG